MPNRGVKLINNVKKFYFEELMDGIDKSFLIILIPFSSKASKRLKASLTFFIVSEPFLAFVMKAPIRLELARLLSITAPEVLWK